ncbi:MAG: hypothetical protein VR72_20600 [Clostridiaceae bacterium BRH_c20a]|nr:MAG: hypothetical protein VR72_20600 [Clostridiaceae bacterium BRH_c20a]
MNYVIIGNSAAGITAAQEIRKLDKTSDILVISREKDDVYSRCLLPDYVSGGISKEQLFIRDPGFYSSNNIKTLYQSNVVGINSENKMIFLEDGSSIHYDKLLIATGSKPFIPPIKGIDKAPVFTLNSLSDAEEIIKEMQNKNKVVIVGGGFIGLELAFALRNNNKEVVVIEKASRILSMQLDHTAAALIRSGLRKAGINLELGVGVNEIVPNSKVLRFFGAKDLKGVILEDGSMVHCDMVVFAAGTKPNIDLIKDSGLTINRGIVVGEFMNTNIPDIYAAGDVAETRDAVTDNQSLSPIWPNAVIQGKYAGWNMAGMSKKFINQVSMQNTSEFREVPFISVGIVNPTNEDEYEILTYHNEEQGVYRKIVLKDNIPVGMIFLGDISNAGVVAGFIRSNKKADKVKEVLLSSRYNYARQLVNF